MEYCLSFNFLFLTAHELYATCHPELVSGSEDYISRHLIFKMTILKAQLI